MNGRDFAIGVLSVTAVILLTGLIIVHAVTPQAALGLGQNAAAGDYLATTSQLDEGTELLFLLDTAAERMNVYGFNAVMGRIELIHQIETRRDRGGERK